MIFLQKLIKIKIERIILAEEFMQLLRTPCLNEEVREAFYFPLLYMLKVV